MAVAFVIVASTRADAQSTTNPSYANSQSFRLEQLLPDSVAQNTDLNAWGWFSYLHDSSRDPDQKYYWESDLALGVTQRFGDNLAATVDMHLLSDNYADPRGFLDQAFLTARLSEQSGTLLTVGKFNADFGVEPRNEWDRLAGTTSLLFGAEPQDLVGLELTQPIGDGRLSLRPFLAAQFDGDSDFHGPPLGGISLQWKPSDSVTLNWTNLVGRGVVQHFDYYFYDYLSEYLYGNWEGVHLHATPGGTLYFSDANVTWAPRPDLTLALEGLIATTGPAGQYQAWGGAMFLANYDITDRWRVFARWSYLNDPLWIVSGATETRNELSGGLAYKLMDGIEIRGEYRHDFAPLQDLDSVSAHLTFSF
jgi:putative OmpL-like beta-barrel porin-2